MTESATQFLSQDSAFQELKRIVEAGWPVYQANLAYEKSLRIYRDNMAALEGQREEGRVEALKENARRMKADNMPAELIAKYTGLDKETIEAL